MYPNATPRVKAGKSSKERCVYFLKVFNLSIISCEYVLYLLELGCLGPGEVQRGGGDCGVAARGG